MAELRAQLGVDMRRVKELEIELEEARNRIADSTKKMYALLDKLTTPTRRSLI
jgi:hypothetical protein